MINLEETYALPSKKMFNVLWDNERNEERFERSKNKITKLISDQNLNGNDKFKLFKSYKKEEFFFDKIHISTRESSYKYKNERISLQFYKEEMNYLGGFYKETMFQSRFSFDVDCKYDFDELFEFLNKKIDEKYYFINLDRLFVRILEKRDTLNVLKNKRKEKKHNEVKERLDRWLDLYNNGQIKLQNKKQPTEYKETKTYILKDNNTGYYKIGKSIDPLNREKTLQSEKPTYQMIKIFNKDVEYELHKKYNNQRQRGEWFNLNKTQVKYICTHY